MRVAVIGAGAMGCLYGGMLTEAGEDVTLVARRQEMADVFNSKGLRIEGIGGDRVIKVKATTHPEALGPVDLVVFFVKDYDTESAAITAKPLMGADTTALTLQNGLGHVPVLVRVLGEGRVVQGVTPGGSTIISPGHIAFTCPVGDHVGELDGRMTGRIRQIAEVFTHSGLECEATDRLQTYVWGKLLLNVGGNAPCAVSGLKDKEVPQVPEGAALAANLVTEAAAVANALGIELPYEDPASTLLNYLDAPIAGKPSTLQDLEQGRRTEIDYLNGAIVAEGQRLGVPTPFNAAVTYIIKMIEQRQRLHAVQGQPG